MARNLQAESADRARLDADLRFQCALRPAATRGDSPTRARPARPDPGETRARLRRRRSGAYSLYNWEIFYHVPMFIASLLLQNQQFQDALTWLEYIFNPDRLQRRPPRRSVTGRWRHSTP